MCGVIGIFPVTPAEKPSKQSKAGQEMAIRYLLTQLLIESEARGGDATGISVVLNTGEWSTLKQPVPAADFLLNMPELKTYEGQDPHANFRAQLRAWSTQVKKEGVSTAAVLGHVRKTTRGETSNPDNNHPVVIENRIIGVHNGTLKNDDVVFEKVTHRKRVGSVDSEAIFHLHHYLAADEAPTVSLMSEISKRLRGAYTTLHINNKFPRVVGGLKRDRPLEVAFFRGIDLVVVASEYRIVLAAQRCYNRFVAASGAAGLCPIEAVASDTITDGINGRVLLYNLDKPYTTMKEWLEIGDGPTKAEELSEFDEAASEPALTSAYHGSGEVDTTPAAKPPWTTMGEVDQKVPASEKVISSAKAIEDASDYAFGGLEALVDESLEVEVEVVDQALVDDAIDEAVERADISVDDIFGGVAVDVNGEAIDMTMLSREGELALEQLKDEPDSLALTALEEAGENLEKIFPNVTTHLEVLVEKSFDKSPGVFQTELRRLLANFCEDVYDTAFPEGYTSGYLSATSDAINALHGSEKEPSTTEQRLAEKLRKATKTVANLKSLVLASLISGGWAELDLSKIRISEALLTYAKYISPEFSPESAERFLNKDNATVELLTTNIKETAAAEETVATEAAEEENEAPEDAVKACTF